MLSIILRLHQRLSLWPQHPHFPFLLHCGYFLCRHQRNRHLGNDQVLQASQCFLFSRNHHWSLCSLLAHSLDWNHLQSRLGLRLQLLSLLITKREYSDLLLRSSGIPLQLVAGLLILRVRILINTYDSKFSKCNSFVC